MPLYEYHCNACQADFELLVTSSTVPTCPKCAATALTRQLSLVAPQGGTTTKRTIAASRKAAAAEGHFSNFSAAERAKLLS